MLCLFVRVMTLDKNTSHELFTVLVDEKGATISSIELATVVARTVAIVPSEGCEGRRDKTLATEQHLIDIA